jgi:hypothetical protein
MTLGRLKWPQNEVPDRKILLWRDLRRCGWIVKDQVRLVNWLRGSPLDHDRLMGLWMTRLDVTKLLWNSAGPQRLKLGSFRGRLTARLNVVPFPILQKCNAFVRAEDEIRVRVRVKVKSSGRGRPLYTC